eukprot:TRINITY_DN0_c38_g1_i4.p1 TRINITY_DN0_c38_g1~~TRINITY_DN0_c38_g1_i4.p1  ORF type:complete len:157 (+),score=63.91 TRINITY_DN0_c38_g1_i4:67-537(+)
MKIIFALLAVLALANAEGFLEKDSELVINPKVINAEQVEQYPCGPEKSIELDKFVTLLKPVKKGITDSFIWTGVAAEDIEMAEVDIKVYMLDGDKKVHITDFKEKDTDSFMEGDKFQYTYTVLIPSFSPSGKYTLDFYFKDTTGKTLVCSNVSYVL